MLLEGRWVGEGWYRMMAFWLQLDGWVDNLMGCMKLMTMGPVCKDWTLRHRHFGHPTLHPLASLSRWDCSALISGIDCITFFHSPVKANLPKLNWKSWKLVLQPQLFMSGNNWFHCKTWQFWSQKTQTPSCKAKLHYSGEIYFGDETGIFKSGISLL